MLLSHPTTILHQILYLLSQYLTLSQISYLLLLPYSSVLRLYRRHHDFPALLLNLDYSRCARRRTTPTEALLPAPLMHLSLSSLLGSGIILIRLSDRSSESVLSLSSVPSSRPSTERGSISLSLLYPLPLLPPSPSNPIRSARSIPKSSSS